jgi:hypothetical protein
VRLTIELTKAVVEYGRVTGKTKAISVSTSSAVRWYGVEDCRPMISPMWHPELGRLTLRGDDGAPASVPRKSPAPIPHDEKPFDAAAT